MQDLKIVLVQTDIVWEDPEKNIIKLNGLLAQIPGDTDIIILPEMFQTGFTMNVEDASETTDGPSILWMKEKADELNTIITGSILTQVNGLYFNRMYWIGPEKPVVTYDKRHLFRMGMEHHVMSAGENTTITKYQDWKFNLQICYDLRFPVWSKNTFNDGNYKYDTLIYVANWPETRRDAYLSLLKARAIENQCYVIWVNRVGEDGSGIVYSGDSMVIDPGGKIIGQAKRAEEEMVFVGLSYSALVECRGNFRVGEDWDAFEVI
ncbi:MAG: nitrilase family protein [Bacteroidales bacterium]|nr:nitrilase family protein [Bacteroidales bacterium]